LVLDALDREWFVKPSFVKLPCTGGVLDMQWGLF
jgi:hypothetical protein